jgi:hypothetical protein
MVDARHLGYTTAREQPPRSELHRKLAGHGGYMWFAMFLRNEDVAWVEKTKEAIDTTATIAEPPARGAGQRRERAVGSDIPNTDGVIADQCAEPPSCRVELEPAGCCFDRNATRRPVAREVPEVNRVELISGIRNLGPFDAEGYQAANRVQRSLPNFTLGDPVSDL